MVIGNDGRVVEVGRTTCHCVPGAGCFMKAFTMGTESHACNFLCTCKRMLHDELDFYATESGPWSE